MYQPKFSDDGMKGSHRGKKRAGVLFLSLLLLTTLLVSGTLAYLTMTTGEIKNVFVPSEVTTEVTEEFDGKEKTNVNAKNTGNIDAWIRMKLVTYRVNDDGNRIGGTAVIPTFTLGTGWVEKNGFYYYTKPVAPNHSPAANLADKIDLVAEYTDADGGKQAIEVMAEAIQADGKVDSGKYAVEIVWPDVEVDVNGTEKTLDLN